MATNKNKSAKKPSVKKAAKKKAPPKKATKKSAPKKVNKKPPLKKPAKKKAPPKKDSAKKSAAPIFTEDMNVESPTEATIQYRAYCDSESKWISDNWGTQAQAGADAQPHIDKGHIVQIKQKIS